MFCEDSSSYRSPPSVGNPEGIFRWRLAVFHQICRLNVAHLREVGSSPQQAESRTDSVWVIRDWNTPEASLNRFAARSAEHRTASWPTARVSAALLLVCALLLAACADAGPAVVEDEVLGVSIVKTSIGTTQIRSLGTGVSVELLETDQAGHSSIALARDGEVIVSSEIGEGEEVDLRVDEPGTYEVWAVSQGEMAEGTNDVQLAAPQTINRIGTVTLGQ